MVNQLPEKIQTLSGNLRTLDVSDNKLANLPLWIGEYKVLKSLNLSKNCLGIMGYINLM